MQSLFEAYKKLKEVNQTTGDTSMPQAGPEKVCPTCKKKGCGCSVEEELKGGQVKLDKNKNGKLDSDDFKKLRKEAADDVPFDGPYTTGFKKAKNPNRTGMDAARALSRKFLNKSKNTPVIQGHEKFTSIADKLKPEHFGKQDKLKEEVLDEANHRDFASAGMMHPDMAKHMNVGDHMDYYEPKTGDKVHGKVMHKSATEVHMKQSHDSYDSKKVGSVHKFKIGSQLPVQEEVEQIDESKMKDIYTDMMDHATKKGYSSHKEFTPADYETVGKQHGISGKELAVIAGHKTAQQVTKEEVEQIDEILTVSMGVSKWIHDFVHSTNPKFKGKSVKERQKMALGAFYAAKKGIKEGVELVYELKKATLASYVKKAGHSIEQHAGDQREAELADWDDDSERKEAQRNVEKRHKGIKNAVKRLAKEEIESIDEISKATIGSYVKKAADDAAITRKIATDFEHRAKTSRKQSMKDANTNIANDYKDKSWKRQDNIKKAVDRLTKEEVEQVEESTHQVAPTVHTQNYTWGKMKTIHQGHDFSIPLHPEHHEAIAKLEHDQEHKFKDETGRHWTAKREGDKVHFDANGLKTTVSHSSMKEETMKSFKDFITEMEFDKNGRYVHKGKYGTSYDDPEGKEDDEKPAAEKAEKRGRGRPAGSKSGARQIGGASKKGSGVEYTGYKLHLPNSNKSY